MSNLNSKWLQFDKTDEERATTEKKVRQSKQILDMLAQMIDKDIKVLETSRLGDYEIANWPYWRADKDGSLRTLRNLRDVLTIKPKEDPHD